MIHSNLDRVLAAIPDDARVLDVGGWAAPLNRADYVLDMMPFETRGVLPPGSFGPGPERFTAETWIRRDMCAKEPYPFEDDFFDFAFCSQTLEDIRDPIFVCEELSRVAKRGYIDVPSILDELCWQVPQPSGGPWVGHTHHRWLITLEEDELVFLHKMHSIHSEPRARIPPRWGRRLAESDRGLGHFWEGRLKARERVLVADLPVEELEAAIVDHFRPSRLDRLAYRVERQLLDLDLLWARLGRLGQRLRGR